MARTDESESLDGVDFSFRFVFLVTRQVARREYSTTIHHIGEVCGSQAILLSISRCRSNRCHPNIFALYSPTSQTAPSYELGGSIASDTDNL